MKDSKENIGQVSEEKIIDMLTPHCEFRASDGLKERVLAAARNEADIHGETDGSKREKTLFILRAAWFAAAAAVLLALFVLNPAEMYRVHAAEKLLATAAEIFRDTPSFEIGLKVRTEPQENFSYINAHAPFVGHRMTVEPSTGRWRLEKPQRTALNDGREVVFWNPQSANGFIVAGTGVLEDFAALLDPYTLLLREEALVRGNRKLSCQKVVSGDIVTLTINAPAEGDFANDYLRNTSIGTSDTRRAYRFDRESGRLLEMQIDAWFDKKAVTILRITDIQYGVPIAEATFARPEGISWTDLRDPLPKGELQFAGITPEQAAEKMFAAMQSWDEGVLKEILACYPLDLMKQAYGGCRLVAHKKHFRSGQYPGVFVPCEIVSADGKKSRITVALRNDNERGAWVADGGL